MLNRLTKPSQNGYFDKPCFQKTLISWFEENDRQYPWRQVTNPYQILLSEILLQQTNADRVVSVYDQLVKEFPEPRSLELAEIHDLSSIMKPLGLHYRASRLKKLGEVLVHKYGGEIPSGKEDLLSLPGVGKYISNAVQCFAFSWRLPLVDVNTMRMYERVFSLQSTKRRAREDPRIWQFAADMLPNDFKRYNWAVIDFCAKMCINSCPACDACPVSWACDWLQSHQKVESWEG